MSWWVYTDTGKTGTCERCKRPLAEHSHTCFACHTNRRPNAVLAPGNVTSFSLHSYKDHPPGMKHSSISICYCPQSAVAAHNATLAATQVAAVQPTDGEPPPKNAAEATLQAVERASRAQAHGGTYAMRTPETPPQGPPQGTPQGTP